MITVAVPHESNTPSPDAPWLAETLARLGIPAAGAVEFLVKHWRPAPLVGEVVEKVLLQREARGTGKKTLRQLRRTLEAFVAAHPVRLDLVTSEEIESFLGRWDGCADKTRSERLFHVNQVFALAVRRGWLSQNPVQGLAHPPRAVRDLPAVLAPARAREIMADLELNHPGWVAYFAVCLFAGVRADLRDGEAGRLDADLKKGVALGAGGEGFFVRSKTHGGRRRFVRIVDCGPLASWLAVYPIADGLIPSGLSYAQAERRLARLRDSYALEHNVLRHTAASSALHAPGASFAAVAIRLGTSESVLKSNYLGLWTPEMTSDLWALTPSASPAQAAA